MRKYFDVVFLTTSIPAAGAYVYVLDSSGNRVSLYSDNGVTSIQNPVTTDRTGFFSFYVADGTYTLQYVLGGVTLRTLTAVQIYDESSASGVSNAIANGTATDAGTLNGSETLPMSRGSGLLQTTLTKIAQWVTQIFQGWVTPQMYGAACNGVIDDTAALQAALTSGKPVRFLVGTMMITSVTVPNVCDFYIGANATLRLIQTGTNAVGVTLNGNGSSIVAYGLIDGNGAGRTPIAIGDGVTVPVGCHAYLYNVQNVSGELFSGTHTEGLLIYGGTDHRFYVKARNFPNNCYNINQHSLARVVTVQGYADRVVGAFDGDNVWIGAALATTSCHLTHARVTNAGEEAIYNLSGINTCDEVVYSGDWQAVVNINGADLYVGRIFHTGGNYAPGQTAQTHGQSTVAVQNAGITQVGVIEYDLNTASNSSVSAASFLTARANNVSSGPVRIGAIRGTMKPVSLTLLASYVPGTIQSVDIQNVDLNVQYDVGVMTSIKNLMDMTIAQEFHLSHWNVRVIDINSAYVNDYFQINLPTTNLVRNSHFADIRFTFYQADATTVSTLAYLNVFNAAQTLVKTKGQIWQGNNMRIREDTAYGIPQSSEDVATTQPAAGTWAVGKFMRNYLPVETGTAGSKYVVTGWVCTGAGTPGTWIPVRALTGN